MHTHHQFLMTEISTNSPNFHSPFLDTSTISKINRLADDMPLGCVDPIILVNACVWYLYDKHRYCEMHDKINTFTRTALHGLKTYVLSSEMNTLL